ncbi:hypothetical protein WA158_002011 [Blastocystis sp. Blastoise]
MSYAEDISENEPFSSKWISIILLAIICCFAGFPYNIINQPLSFGTEILSDLKTKVVAISTGIHRQFLFESFTIVIMFMMFIGGFIIFDHIEDNNSDKVKRMK